MGEIRQTYIKLHIQLYNHFNIHIDCYIVLCYSPRYAKYTLAKNDS